jgi:hypothetical protein
MLQRTEQSGFQPYERKRGRRRRKEKTEGRKEEDEEISPLCLITGGIYNHGCCSGGR